MKKIIKPFLIGVISILIGIFSTIFWTKHQPQKPINFSITNKNVVPKNVNYSSSKLPQIRMNQASAIQKFKSLYSNAVVKSISLALKNDIYVYTIVGFDSVKDCTIQLDATNNKIIGQSTQLLDYDYTKEEALNLKKTISRQEANEIAIKELRGATPILWELSDENGKAIWKINLIYQNQKRQLKIDALNKNII
ncbi:PepSY domain-containing protein [Lactobacillus helveticus]|uniref:PepSY domain-containing protein n=1 Tax=Lactobacillus helveticus TaxID=1587 RepID=UPI002017D201|nr:PepSY domain-containing protein [Lactobacillus helveticus]